MRWPGINRLKGEKVEVDRLAMPQAQRHRRAAVKGEGIRHLDQLGPEPPLRLGQDIQARDERVRHHILNTPNCVSGMGAFRLAEMARPRTSRVWIGSMTPSSHRRAVAK